MSIGCVTKFDSLPDPSGHETRRTPGFGCSGGDPAPVDGKPSTPGFGCVTPGFGCAIGSPFSTAEQKAASVADGALTPGFGARLTPGFGARLTPGFGASTEARPGSTQAKTEKLARNSFPTAASFSELRIATGFNRASSLPSIVEQTAAEEVQ